MRASGDDPALRASGDDAPVAAPGETPAREGFQDRIGLVITHREPDAVRGELEATGFHLNRSGVVHGGVYASILDAALCSTGLHCPHPGRVRRAVTLSLTTKFTAATGAGRLRVEARRVAGGRRIYTATGHVTNAEGEVLAHAMGSFQYRRGSETEWGEALDGLRDAADPT